MPEDRLEEQEWSHFFDAADLNANQETKLVIEASEEELKDLARRLDVEAVKSATAELLIKREVGVHRVYVLGNFTAEITQACIVTTEAFDAEISGAVEGWFADKAETLSFAAAKREREIAKSSGEIEIIDEKEDPEPIVDGLIDLGELVTQHISLAIPPYPRIEGAEYDYGDEKVNADENSPLRKNPFEALKDWKEKR